MAAQSQQQLVQMPFALGIDERTQGEHVEPGKFQVLENIRQVAQGAAGKRNGFSRWTNTRVKLVGGTTNLDRSEGKKLLTVNGAPAVITGHHLDVKFGADAFNWATVDRVPHVLTERVRVAAVGATAATGVASAAVDVAYVNGFYVLLYMVGTSFYTVVLDGTTYAPIAPAFATAQYVSASTRPQVIGVGSTAIVVYNSANNEISAFAINCASATLAAAGAGAPVAIAVNYSNYNFWAHALTTNFAVAYACSGGTPTVAQVIIVSTALAVTATGGSALAGNVGVVTLGGTAADTLWLAAANATNLNVQVTGFNPTTAAVTVAQFNALTLSAANLRVKHVSIARTGAATALVAASGEVSTNRQEMQSATIAGGAPVVTRTYHNVELCSEIWAQGTRYYAYVRPYANAESQDCVFVAEIESGPVGVPLNYAVTPVANAVCRLASAGPYQGSGTRAHITTITGTTKFASIVATRKNGVATGCELVFADFDHREQWSSASIADVTHIASGVPCYSDGLRVVEEGFLVRPAKPVPSLSGVGITAATGWQYIAIYERIDAAGNLHWSALSDPSISTGPVANQTVTVTIHTLPFGRQAGTSLDGATNIALYRTIDGLGVYYRLDTVANITGAATVSYADTTTDATLATRAQLYRQISVPGAALNRQCPPCLRFLKLHRDRLFGVADDLVSVWFSALHTFGEGMWFSDLFQFPVEEGGRIFGLASMDGRLYVFKRNHIFVVDGDGPADNGTNGEFSPPSKLPSAIGCIESRSIVESPAGIFFQSDRGIELLSRSQEVAWIGERIQTTLATYPVITSAVVDAKESLVYFTCAASETSSAGVGATGVTLVFDYSTGEWVSVDKRSNGAAASPASQGACMVSFGGALMYAQLETTGFVYYENDASYLDMSGWVTVKATTAWMKLGGLQGQQEVSAALLLATKATDHNAVCAVDYDYVTSKTQTMTRARVNIDAVVAALGREQLEFRPANNRTGMSVRLTLTDATPSTGTVGTGQGATWIGLALEIAAKPGKALLPTVSRGG